MTGDFRGNDAGEGDFRRNDESGGRYLDRLERREGRWKIGERNVIEEWNRVDDIVEAYGPRERFRWGTKDKSDPVYSLKRGRLAREVLSDPKEIVKHEDEGRSRLDQLAARGFFERAQASAPYESRRPP